MPDICCLCYTLLINNFLYYATRFLTSTFQAMDVALQDGHANFFAIITYKMK